ncbi:MAG: shikimate dehydrogenase [Deltaproteobacteria bacterium]|nr:shikimate dehydrogenase [Deltaproteobacteria bacterium]
MSPPSAAHVVTLPPGLSTAGQQAFGERARAAGAALLELRNDLYADADVAPAALAQRLPLVVSRRGRPLARSWVDAARWVDIPLGEPSPVEASRLLRSFHAERPLGVDEAVALWRGAEAGAARKHVEPLGTPTGGWRLLEVQAGLGVGATVLATGPLALPFRAVLAERNALDYCALDGDWAAAAGQRLLADARRAATAPAGTPRLGILGTHIGHSRSPAVHRAPFDRIDLPPDADVAGLLEALHPHYRGFAVTRPFKRAVAARVGAGMDAVNTLYRQGTGWGGANTDVDGAEATLRALAAREVTVLGAGGVAPALLAAAGRLGVVLRMRRRADLAGTRVEGTCIWTWPEELAPPEGLRLEGAQVAVIAYGEPGRAIAAQVASRGGTVLHQGEAWFEAQAAAQRRVWRAGA